MQQRKQYTKEEKMIAIYEHISGAAPIDALISVGYKVENPIIKDKKYAPKLIHKWKQEYYENQELNTKLGLLYNYIMFNKKYDQQEKDKDIITKIYTQKFKEKAKEEEIKALKKANSKDGRTKDT